MSRYVPVVLITAGILLFGVTVAAALVPPPEEVQLVEELTALKKANTELKKEHEALEEWVAEELEPWTQEVAEVIEPSPGPPSPAALPSLPPVPSEVPSPSLSPVPSPSVDLGPSVVPTPEPSPSICLPIICEGSVGP